MDQVDFINLSVGDMVRGKSTGTCYIITGDFGTRKTGISTVDITNDIEWELVAKANITLQETEFTEDQIPKVFMCSKCGAERINKKLAELCCKQYKKESK